MEKKIVRTFGAALSAATLSFGLFAAPAIADVVVLDKTPAVSIHTADGVAADYATAGSEVDATIPIATGHTDNVEIPFIMATITRDGVTQDIAAHKWVFLDADANETTDVNKAEYIRATFAISGKLMDGTWTVYDIWISSDGDAAVQSKLDGSFTVKQATPAAHAAAPTISGVTVTGTQGNRRLEIAAAPVLADGNGISPSEAISSVIVAYTLPGGKQIVREAELANGKYVVANLEEGIAGTYKLDYVEAINGDDVATFANGDAVAGGDYTVADGAKVLYRLYNQYDGQHLYTSSTTERDNAVKAGWTDEGLAWYTPASGDPVYRLYNKWTGEHHFTTGATERSKMIADGWIDEGEGFKTEDQFGAKVYRLFNPYATVGTHHYTTSGFEYDALGALGWNQEEIGWYAYLAAERPNVLD